MGWELHSALDRVQKKTKRLLNYIIVVVVVVVVVGVCWCVSVSACVCVRVCVCVCLCLCLCLRTRVCDCVSLVVWLFVSLIYTTRHAPDEFVGKLSELEFELEVCGNCWILDVFYKHLFGRVRLGHHGSVIRFDGGPASPSIYSGLCIRVSCIEK